MTIKKDVSLSSFTTLGVGGKATYFSKIRSVEDLKRSLLFAKKNKLPIFILGGGSNILISDKGFDGLVVKMEIKGIKSIKKISKEELIRVGAGEVWDDFVLKMLRKNLWGIECLSGIPGTVGAGPMQNIGAYGQEVKDTVEYVEAIGLKDLSLRIYKNHQCDFGYRNSRFKEKNDVVITHVVFRFKKNIKPVFAYKELQKYFWNKDPSIEEIRRKILKIRKLKSMVYSKIDTNSHSTGSFFVNPIVKNSIVKDLILQYPDIPLWKVDNRFTKLSAAWLIENSGFIKGYKYKTAFISEKHTLAIVNRGNAKAQDIYDFANLIIKKVFKKFKIRLSPETQFLGDFN